MFSRYRNATAAATILACLAPLIVSSVLLSEPSYARTPVTPVVQPGDPDEFETSVSIRSPGDGDKRSMSGDSSIQKVELVSREVRQGEMGSRRESVLRKCRTIFRAFGASMGRLVMELGVR